MHGTLSINICSQVFQNSDGESIEINQTPYVMRCAIWYHLCNLKNVKNTHGGVLLLVTKSNTPPRVFFTFFNL